MAFAWKSHTVIWRRMGYSVAESCCLIALDSPELSIRIAVWGGQAIIPVATNPLTDKFHSMLHHRRTRRFFSNGCLPETAFRLQLDCHLCSSMPNLTNQTNHKTFTSSIFTVPVLVTNFVTLSQTQCLIIVRDA